MPGHCRRDGADQLGAGTAWQPGQVVAKLPAYATPDKRYPAMIRVLTAACLLILAACESRQPATQAGVAVDRAGTRTGQAVDRTATATGAALERSGEWVRDRTR